MFKKYFIANLIISGTLFYAGIDWSAEYHVSPSGNDSNPGTLESPWQTICKANQTLQAGDCVLIHGGVYNEDINPVNQGAEGQEIIYSNYNNEDVIVTGYGNNPDAEGVVGLGWGESTCNPSWTSVKYITVDGITINPTNCKYGVIIFGNGTEYITIRNCTIINSGSGSNDPQGINIGWGARHTLIENCTIDGNWDIGLITTESPKYTIVRNNRIYNSYGSCVDIQTSYGQNQAFLVENNELAYSQIEDGIQFEMDYSLPFDPGSKRGVVIRNNNIHENAENGNGIPLRDVPKSWAKPNDLLFPGRVFRD